MPLLQRILRFMNSTSHFNERSNAWIKTLKVPQCVRVETGIDVNVALDTVSNDGDEAEQPDSILDENFSALSIDVDSLEQGSGAAWEFDGYGTLRGYIQKVEEKSSEDGKTFILKFTNGKRLQMRESKAKQARKLYQEQISKLMSTGMSSEFASRFKETASFNGGSNALLTEAVPVLSVEDEEEGDCEIEQKYETKFVGEVPTCIVGLEYPKNKNGVDWLDVMEKLAKRVSSDRIETTNEVYSVLKAESFIGRREANNGTSEGSPPKKNRTE